MKPLKYLNEYQNGGVISRGVSLGEHIYSTVHHSRRVKRIVGATNNEVVLTP